MNQKKKIFTLFFICLVFVGIQGILIAGDNVKLKISMNPDGENLHFEHRSNMNIWFDKGDKIEIVVITGDIYKKKQRNTTCSAKEYQYRVTIESKNLENIIPIYGGAKPEMTALTQHDIKFKKTIELEDSGKNYTVKVLRFDSLDEKLKNKNAATIFSKVFKTHSRYTFGFDLGLFFPVHNTQEYQYSIKYEGPDDPKPTLSEETIYRARILLLAAFYPFRYEPTRNFGNKTWKRIKINVGTEVSKNVLERYYFGLGFELKGMSISLLGSIGQEDELDPQYTPFMYVDPAKITSVPLRKNKRVFRLGISVNVPFQFASGFMGKLFGL